MERDYKDHTDLIVNISGDDVANTLDAHYAFTPGARAGGEREVVRQNYVVRRLTPKECCRLQGFPDWWDADVEGSDSARYRMWGNGVALPCVFDVLRRIAEADMTGDI
jgi:DNA (cytosine-5)-methyltransferase 1